MPTPSEELRRRIVADINAGDPGSKLGSERDLAERYKHQPLQSAPGAGGAGRSGSGPSGDRPIGRHLHQPRPGATQSVRRRRRARLSRQPGLRGGNPGDLHEDRRRPTAPPRRHCASAQTTSSSRSSGSALPTALPSRWSSRSFRPTPFRDCSNNSSADRSTKSWRRTTVSSPPAPRSGSRRSTPRLTEASLLGIKPKSALLLITRVTYDQHGISVRVLPRPVPGRPHASRGHRAGTWRRNSIARRHCRRWRCRSRKPEPRQADV